MMLAPHVHVLVVTDHLDRLLDEWIPRHCAIEDDVFLIIDCGNEHPFSVAGGVLMHELADPWVVAQPVRQYTEHNVLVFDCIRFYHHCVATHLHLKRKALQKSRRN